MPVMSRRPSCCHWFVRPAGFPCLCKYKSIPRQPGACVGGLASQTKGKAKKDAFSESPSDLSKVIPSTGSRNLYLVYFLTEVLSYLAGTWNRARENLAVCLKRQCSQVSFPRSRAKMHLNSHGAPPGCVSNPSPLLALLHIGHDQRRNRENSRIGSVKHPKSPEGPGNTQYEIEASFSHPCLITEATGGGDRISSNGHGLSVGIPGSDGVAQYESQGRGRHGRREGVEILLSGPTCQSRVSRHGLVWSGLVWSGLCPFKPRYDQTVALSATIQGFISPFVPTVMAGPPSCPCILPPLREPQSGMTIRVSSLAFPDYLCHRHLDAPGCDSVGLT
ncbi:uncharacterized protein LY79DRAFT_659140 [Colletotrichum navitas]|uniref:Uncharacterized protein n=1 Tax=Colletotrichum navitas TaxID=681940 RepID=A0AAD8PZV9_9PEZI|nr:uncharacterized protein LY79DRAFT_659140 [Colletotrichum navitas]KAK1593182.1 hypothetical protein LY79DRAFT_659140 [Colletotrichum navitas]